MPVDVLEGLLPLGALVALGTFGLIGMKLWLKAKANRLREGGSDHIARLGQQIDDLVEQVGVLRDGHTEIHERLDFTERMLTTARDEEGR